MNSNGKSKDRNFCQPAPFLGFVFCLTMLMFGSTTIQKAVAQKNKLDWPRIHVKDGIQTLPAELVENIPFSLAGSYELPEEENREQLYLQAVVEFVAAESANVEKSVMTKYPVETDFYRSRAFRKVYKDRHKKLNRMVSFIDDHSESQSRLKIEEKDVAKGKRLAKDFDPLFEKLKAAQDERPSCFLHRSSRGDGLPTELIFQILQVRFLVEPENDQCLTDLAIVLQLQNDLRVLTSYWPRTNPCFERIIGPMLSWDDQPEAHLERLVEILKSHRDEQKKLDPVVESARRYYLVSRQVLNNLENESYRKNPLYKGPGYNEVQEVFWVLNQAFVRRSNDWNAKWLPIRWKDSRRPKSEINDVLSFAQTLGNPKKIERQLDDRLQLQKYLVTKIKAMTANDFDRDRAVLIKRYREVEAACRLPFPASTNQLNGLVDNWTSGNQWKSSLLLLWYQPERFPSRAAPLLEANAYLCMAAIKLWRKKHKGENPESLTEALAAVGIDEPVIDPHSGQSLIWMKDKNRIRVYSVGFDGVDDKGKRISQSRLSEFRIELRPGEPIEIPTGDIVFEIN